MIASQTRRSVFFKRSVFLGSPSHWLCFESSLAVPQDGPLADSCGYAGGAALKLMGQKLEGIVFWGAHPRPPHRASLPAPVYLGEVQSPPAPLIFVSLLPPY